MARPRRANVFEVMLPDTLPQAEQWLYEYHRNCLTHFTYLATNGAKTTAYYGAIKCLCGLKEYLLEHKTVYSCDNALIWLRILARQRHQLG